MDRTAECFICGITFLCLSGSVYSQGYAYNTCYQFVFPNSMILRLAKFKVGLKKSDLICHKRGDLLNITYFLVR